MQTKLLRTVLDEHGMHMPNAYRISFPGIPTTLIHNYLHEVEQLAIKRSMPIPPLKLLVSKGMHIILAKEKLGRLNQRVILHHVANTYYAWFDSDANVWKVEPEPPLARRFVCHAPIPGACTIECQH